MKPLPDPEGTIDRFAVGLARTVSAEGWQLNRHTEGHSNRGFVLDRDQRQICFFAKLSQNERGFWGLSEAKASELAKSSSEHLVLLTGAFDGYFIAAGRLARLLPAFARVQRDGAYRINENKLRPETRFKTLMSLWDFLKSAQ